VRLALVAAMDRRCRRSDGPLLESLLADPHAIIVTAAVRVLGHCRHKESVPVLSDVYRRTDHWYVQDATFRALRGLK